MRPLLLIPVVVVSACSNQAPPASEGPVTARSAPLDDGERLRKNVLSLLSGYERVPTDEDWKRVGPSALAVLEEIYRDPNARTVTRMRAVSSLGMVHNPAAVDSLKQILRDAATDDIFRATAATAYAFRTGEAALPALEPALDDPSSRVREAAARAVGKLGSSDARRLLEDRLAREEDPAVREVLQQSLTKTQP